MNHDENLTYEWLRNLRNKLIKEEKVRDFVSGNIAKTAQAVGALDINFTHGAGDDITLDPNWVQQNITTVTLHDGQRIQFNKNYAELLVNAFRNACEASRMAGKPFCPKNNGAFNTRTLRGKEKISNHAFGTAIDFLTAGTQTQITNYPEFINTMKQSGFIWGGDWKPEYYDPMHFEVNVGGAVPAGVGGGAGVEGVAANFSNWQTHAINALRSLGVPDDPLGISGASKTLSEAAGFSGRLSDDQIAKLCYDVGFRGEDLVTAVRIVMGESGGDPSARNVNVQAKGKYKDSVDRGLFQLNNVAFANVPDNEAYDPIKNAQYAYAAFRKYGFRPWKGRTQFHTLKWKDLTPDTDKIERAKNAVAKLTGYTSTGNFEYLSGVAGGPMSTSGSIAAGGEQQYSDWKQFASSSLSKMGITESEDKLINPKDKFKVKDKTKDQKLEKNKKVLLDMLSFYDKKLKFEKPVLIKFVDDEENASKLLGKTAFYDPNKSSITIFTTNRLLKDILRSLGHELIHHKQHCKDEFHDVQTFEGYAQKDKKLRRKEKEAYLFGNMLFRDWEDNYKSNHKETR